VCHIPQVDEGNGGVSRLPGIALLVILRDWSLTVFRPGLRDARRRQSGTNAYEDLMLLKQLRAENIITQADLGAEAAPLKERVL
jgi:hypothetical protein